MRGFRGDGFDGEGFGEQSKLEVLEVLGEQLEGANVNPQDIELVYEFFKQAVERDKELEV